MYVDRLIGELAIELYPGDCILMHQFGYYLNIRYEYLD